MRNVFSRRAPAVFAVALAAIAATSIVGAAGPEAAVRKVAADSRLPLVWAMGNPDLARSFGDISAVPTLFLFDRSGSTAAAFYGAPPTLHGDAEGKLATLLR